MTSPRQEQIMQIVHRIGMDVEREQKTLLSPQLTKICDVLDLQPKTIYKGDKMEAVKQHCIDTHKDYDNQSRFALDELEQINEALAEHLKS